MNVHDLPTVVLANIASENRDLILNVLASRECRLVEIHDDTLLTDNTFALPILFVVDTTRTESRFKLSPFDICRMLRGVYSSELTRILMIVDGSEESINRALVGGADDCVTIPIIAPLLGRRIDLLFGIMQPHQYALAQLGEEVTWNLIGQAFFDAAVKSIGDLLRFDYVFVGEFDDHHERVDTISYYARGQIEVNFDYQLDGTPCKNVLTLGVCSYPRDVQALFPNDQILKDIDVEGYIGFPLFDSTGRPIGLIGVMHREPIVNEMLAITMMQMIVDRASHELERIRKDKALRDAEMFTRSALDGLTSRIAIIDQSGQIVAVNQSWRVDQPDKLGQCDEGANYLAMCEELAKEEIDAAATVAESIRAMFAGQLDRRQLEYSFEYNGTRLWSLMRLTRFKGLAEKPYVIISQQDITNLRAVELSKRVNDEAFRSLINDLSVGVLLQGPNAEILLFNPAAKELLGLTEDQLLGRSSFDPSWNVIHEDGEPFPGTAHPVPTAIRTRKPVYGVVMGVYRPTTNNRVWLWVNAEPQLDELGEVRQVICTFSDITERWTREENTRELNLVLEQLILERTAQAEAEKRQSEMILQNVADGILFTDTNANILYANPAWEKMTGYTFSDVIGKNPSFLQSGATSSTLFKEMWDKIGHGELWTGVFHNRRKDGTIYQAESTIAPVTNALGVSYFVEIQRDVTEQLELAEMKDRFMANLTHDLGNPVSVLKTSLFLIKRDEAHQVEYFQRIEREVNRLSEMISDLMTLTEMDRQAVKLNLAPLDINILIEQLVSQQKTLASEKGLTLTFEPTPEIRPVSGDVKQIERVIVNLIGNAINYTSRGGITICTNQDVSSTWFSIKDTGIGISGYDLPHIFDRFYRADTARAVSKGTGLGLPIVKEIVELHNGKITVQSTVGEGTEFTIYLRNC
jgi:PAS domain S-box-containing protein